MSRTLTKKPESKTIRCAVYTRKSTEDGLEQEFNSLDAQREAGEAYIKSQKHEGWQCLTSQYDDGGFTGANMERPALRRLLDDIEAGKVDCVVVYKVDRLSRSLLDFARIMEAFDKHQVAFVSVTQAFNTATSMGRLVLNVLLSFAQFEREMISERTSDKIAAARRKGKWSGGMPILGYTVMNTKLIVDKTEADRVREIFRLYIEHQSALTVTEELNNRGWRTKLWTTRKNIRRGGRVFNRNTLYQLLTNVTYIGKIRYKTETHTGEHEPIIDVTTFEKVQAILRLNGKTGGSALRNKHTPLLRGKLRCGPCDCGMSHTYTKKGRTLYRYYVCHRAQKQGWQKCPSPSLPAGEIERFVIDQIKRIGRDPAVIRDTLAQARRQSEVQLERLKAEKNGTQRKLRNEVAQIGKLSAAAGEDDSGLVEARDRIRILEQRLAEIDAEVAVLSGEKIDEDEVIAALAGFDELWDSLTPREQERIIDLLIDRVTYDGHASKLSITYRSTGIKTLAEEIGSPQEQLV
jgi:site-specific DNA recombinase